MTYGWTQQGWLYLAVVIDLYARKVAGWSMGRRLKSTLVCDARQMEALALAQLLLGVAARTVMSMADGIPAVGVVKRREREVNPQPLIAGYRIRCTRLPSATEN